jgi:hypothetical protein
MMENTIWRWWPVGTLAAGLVVLGLLVTALRLLASPLRSRRRWGFASLATLSAAVLVGHLSLTRLLRPEDFSGYTTPDASRSDGWTALFPPWTDCPIRPAAAASQINSLELVIGVELDGDARAYPVNMLNERAERKALNDVLGGQAIAVTF